METFRTPPLVLQGPQSLIAHYGLPHQFFRLHEVDNSSMPTAPNSSSKSRITDPSRLTALHEAALLDTPDEEAFDRFTRMAAQLLGCPVSLVSLVDEHRQYFKSAFGLDESVACNRETPLSHSFCQHVVTTGGPLVITDARKSSLVRDNGAIRDLGVVAYLGMPLITKEGHALGSLCAIDAQPREWPEESIQILQSLAAMVMTEIDLRITARRLRATYEQLRSTEAERDELVHMLVHDLRNPLSSMLMALELAEGSGEDENQNQMLNMARISGQRLLRMVGEILEVNKVDLRGMQLCLQSVAPQTLVKAAQEQVGPSAEAARIKLQAALAPNLEPVVVDSDKLQRVLINLLANAIQHSSPGKAITTRVEMNASRDAFVFEVEDEGSGIPPEFLDGIFDKYGTAAARKKGAVSSGLGLAFCKKVVEAHGGEITVTSELHKGSTFRLTIPTVPPIGLAKAREGNA